MEKIAQQVLQRRDCRPSAGALRAWQVSLRGSRSVSVEQMRQDNICRLQMSDGNRAQEPSHRSTFIELSPFYKSGPMFPEPRYLQLEEELFPSITLYKELLFHNPFTGFHCEIFERVAYDSVERSIDLTDCLDQVLKKEYGTHADLEIMVFDPILHDYRLLAYFPIDANITLGEQFLQLDVIAFRLRPLPPLSDAFPDTQAAPKQSEHAIQSGDGEAASGWEKGKRRKSTIRQLLEVVERWRVMWMDSGCKMTMAEGAAQMGISKRSLLFYIHNAKMGEKYHFDFHANLDRKIVELTAFVQEKAQLKKNEEAELISKLKTYYK